MYLEQKDYQNAREDFLQAVKVFYFLEVWLILKYTNIIYTAIG